MLTYTPDVFSNIKTSDYVCVGADKIQVKILHLMLWLDSSGLRWLCCSAASRRWRRATEQISRRWRTALMQQQNKAIRCLFTACKSGVFVLGDVQAQHAVHYSWRYATAETLFQRSTTESDQLDKKPNQKVLLLMCLFLWWYYRASLAVLCREKHQRDRSVSFPHN